MAERDRVDAVAMPYASHRTPRGEFDHLSDPASDRRSATVVAPGNQVARLRTHSHGKDAVGLRKLAPDEVPRAHVEERDRPAGATPREVAGIGRKGHVDEIRLAGDH